MREAVHGFTTKQVRQKRDSDIAFANARGEKTQSSGFTLVELLVVFAIIGSVMSVVLTSQNTFNKTLILTNTAYDIALSLRAAETYGLGGHAIGSRPAGYGIHFDKNTPGAFLLFADSDPAPSVDSVCHATTDPTALDAQPGDCAYTAGRDGPVVTSYVLGNRITISDLCAYTAIGTRSCTDSGLNSLDIVFARPNPDPHMSMNGMYSPSSPVTSACITVSSPQGGARYIWVASSGQIIANAAPCP